MNTATTNIAGSVSNLNFRSRLENVSQSIGQLPNADQSTIQELMQLLGQLQAELKKLSDSNPDRGEQIEAVAASIEELVNQAKQKKPNQIPLQQAIAEAEAISGKLEGAAPAFEKFVAVISGMIAKLAGSLQRLADTSSGPAAR